MSPLEHTLCGLKNSSLEVGDIGLGHIVLSKVVRAKFTPIEDTLGHVADGQLTISAGANVVQVVLVVPKIILGNLVRWKHGQEVLAGRQRHTTHQQTTGKKELAIYFVCFHYWSVLLNPTDVILAIRNQRSS